MAVTIQKIAELAGVSRGTVDRALNNRGRINPEIEKKIKKIAAERGYQPHRAGSALARSKNPIKLGVIVQSAKTSFMKQVLEGIRQADDELNGMGAKIILRTILSVDAAEQVKIIDELLLEGIQGLALAPVDDDRIRNKINHILEKRHLPIIIFNSDISGTKRACFVGQDNVRSGRVAAGLMGMITGGTGKVLIIIGYRNSLAHNYRFDGFVEEIEQNYPGIEILGLQTSFDETDIVEKITRSTLQENPDLAGIFITSGGQAGLCSGLKSMGFSGKICVIAYDITPETEQGLLDDNISILIDQNAFAQGYRPPILLFNYLTKGEKPDSEYNFTDIIIKTKYNL